MSFDSLEPVSSESENTTTDLNLWRLSEAQLENLMRRAYGGDKASQRLIDTFNDRLSDMEFRTSKNESYLKDCLAATQICVAQVDDLKDAQERMFIELRSLEMKLMISSVIMLVFMLCVSTAVFSQ